MTGATKDSNRSSQTSLPKMLGDGGGSIFAARGRGGFSLVEMLIALGILQVGLLGVLMLFFAVNRSRHESERLGVASNLSAEKMQQLLSDETEIPGAGFVSFEEYGFAPDFPEYRRYTVVEGPPNAPLGMRRLRVGTVWRRVSGESTSTGNSLTVSSVFVDRGSVELQTYLR